MSLMVMLSLIVLGVVVCCLLGLAFQSRRARKRLLEAIECERGRLEKQLPQIRQATASFFALIAAGPTPTGETLLKLQDVANQVATAWLHLGVARAMLDKLAGPPRHPYRPYREWSDRLAIWLHYHLLFLRTEPYDDICDRFAELPVDSPTPDEVLARVKDDLDKEDPDGHLPAPNTFTVFVDTVTDARGEINRQVGAAHQWINLIAGRRSSLKGEADTVQGNLLSTTELCDRIKGLMPEGFGQPLFGAVEERLRQLEADLETARETGVTDPLNAFERVIGVRTRQRYLTAVLELIERFAGEHLKEVVRLRTLLGYITVEAPSLDAATSRVEASLLRALSTADNPVRLQSMVVIRTPFATEEGALADCAHVIEAVRAFLEKDLPAAEEAIHVLSGRHRAEMDAATTATLGRQLLRFNAAKDAALFALTSGNHGLARQIIRLIPPPPTDGAAEVAA